MRVFVPLLAIVLVACHASEVAEDQTATTYANGKLVKPLEKFKEVLKKGEPKFGLPQLDPYNEEHMDVNLNSDGLVSVKGSLDKIRESGVSNYEVLQGDFTIAGLKVNISLLWDQIDLMSNYDLKGVLGTSIEFYGKGTVSAVVRGLQAFVYAKLSVQDEHLFVSQLILNLHIKKLDFKVTGMYDDEETSQTVSTIVSGVVPGLLDDYQDKLMNKLEPVLQKKANEILKKFTLKDLLGIISG